MMPSLAVRLWAGFLKPPCLSCLPWAIEGIFLGVSRKSGPLLSQPCLCWLLGQACVPACTMYTRTLHGGRRCGVLPLPSTLAWSLARASSSGGGSGLTRMLPSPFCLRRRAGFLKPPCFSSSAWGGSGLTRMLPPSPLWCGAGFCSRPALLALPWVNAFGSAGRPLEARLLRCYEVQALPPFASRQRSLPTVLLQMRLPCVQRGASTAPRFPCCPRPHDRFRSGLPRALCSDQHMPPRTSSHLAPRFGSVFKLFSR